VVAVKETALSVCSSGLRSHSVLCGSEHCRRRRFPKHLSQKRERQVMRDTVGRMFAASCSE